MLHTEFRYSDDYQDTKTCPPEVFILKVQYAPSSQPPVAFVLNYPL